MGTSGGRASWSDFLASLAFVKVCRGRGPRGKAGLALSDMHALLVEDNGADAMVAQRYLARLLDSPVVWVDSLADALNHLRETSVDVIVTDLGLPDAWDTLAVEKLRRAAPNTPIIALSGQDDDEVGERVLQVGAQDYMCKDDLTERSLRRSIRYARQRHALQLELEHRAHQDGLTGLGNRTAFDHDIQELVVDQTPFGIVLVDVDKFKLINDRLGHPVGDSVLRQMALRANGALDAGAKAYRVGGDELAVLFAGCESLADTHKHALHIVDVLSSPVLVGEHRVDVTVSGGCSHFPSELGSLEDVVRVADTRLYAAKASGRAQLGEVNSGQLVAIDRRLEWELRAAVRTHAFELVYQPLARLGQSEPCAFEALLRWNPDGEGSVGPDVFVPILERCGLIASVGERVLRESLAWVAEFRRLRNPAARVSVNVSPLQIGLPGFSNLVSRSLDDAGLTGDALCVELTEGAVLTDLLAARTAMEGLREMGVGIAIDDFGTGNASLSLLMELPFTQLKIDQSFVRRRDDAVVQAIMALAHSLNLVVVVEGVESEEQATWVRELGGDAIQGFWVGTPLAGQAWLSEPDS